jgi:hypothetical protein
MEVVMDILFGLDQYMFSLIDGSGFVILVLLGMLKILAKETKWSGDDKIVGLFLGMIRAIKTPKEEK